MANRMQSFLLYPVISVIQAFGSFGWSLLMLWTNPLTGEQTTFGVTGLLCRQCRGCTGWCSVLALCPSCSRCSPSWPMAVETELSLRSWPGIPHHHHPRPRARQSVQCFPTLQTPECMSVITLMAAVSEALISTNDKGNCHFNEATIFFTLCNNLMVQLPLKMS